MPTRVKAHRASAQRRRTALLEAAAELSAELGAGAVTHRAVAARAGVPLSTTSYFFSSIDELVTEALRLGAIERTEAFEAAEKAVEEAEASCIDTALGAAVDRALDTSRTASGSQVEFYLAAGRQEELRADATAMLAEETASIEGQLERVHAPQAAVAGAAMTDLADGAMLHRLGVLDLDHRARLAAGLRLLTAAAMLTDAEVAQLLERYQLPVDPSGATFEQVLGAPSADGTDPGAG
ncbi:MAG: TetR family transcriptional regulator [Acidimicrobiales bacterium]